MASKTLFKSTSNKLIAPPANAINEAGGAAYNLGTEHTLAQFAATGMLGDTFYTSAADQLNTVLSLSEKVSGDYLAKLAVYSRESGKLKDMPALIAAILFARVDERALKTIFLRVINNGRMLRNFVQVVRSGVTGRKSLGTLGKKLVASYFESKTPDQLFRETVGNDPSLADVIKLAHVRPTSPTRQALYRYIISKEMDFEQVDALPQLVKDFEMFKEARTKNDSKKLKIPAVPFEMLTALPLTTDDWKQIAQAGGWHFVRMNINTFARHGVLDDKEVVRTLATKLADKDEIQKARVMPYQLFIAYLNAGTTNKTLANALQDALDASLDNVKPFDVNGVAIAVDTSGSMKSTVSGAVTSSATCVDVAALFASAILRRNPESEILPFDTAVHRATFNPRDSVMTNADKLRVYGGGGTACSVALADLNARKVKADLVVYLSDNESWVDVRNLTSYPGWSGIGSTATMAEWVKFKARNPRAKLVNINITPAGTSQASNNKDILNIGGFSDAIFETISNFVSGQSNDNFVDVVNAIEL
jgi:60 kDa SS-A/Ro ribonucleoprotein